MRVRAGDADGQRQTGPLSYQMDLRAVLALGPQDSGLSGPPFQGSHVYRVDRAAGPVQLAADTELIEDQAVKLRPHLAFDHSVKRR